jgi:hypothetical protein
MPHLGFGVYQNYNTRPSVLTAFATGYRYVIDFAHHWVTVPVPRSDLPVVIGMSIQPRRTITKPQSVKPSKRVASNEATYSSVRYVHVKVGFITYCFGMEATKCVSKTHGYESTLKGVDESLAKFGFGRR